MPIHGNVHSPARLGSNLSQKTMTVLKADDYLYLRSPYGATTDIVQKLFIRPSELAFSPAYTTFVIDKTSPDVVSNYEAGTLIHIAPDDSAPLFLTSSFIGGAHGYSGMIEITATNHGKTYQDVGSQWVDSVAKKFTIVKIVDTDHIWIIPNDETPWQYPIFVIRYSTTGNLTHFSGATNTAGITIASKVAGQMIPSIKNKILSIKLDGLTLGGNGIYKANTVVIDESYDVVNPASAIVNLQARVGSLTAPEINVGDTMFTQETKYTFYAASCLVYNKFTPKQTMSFGYYGFMQSGPLYPSGVLTKLKQYIPKTLPIALGGTDYDFRTVKDITSLPATASFSAAYWANADSPPERSIQYLSTAADALQHGFALGYLKGKGVELTLKDSATVPFKLQNTKKQYPQAIDKSVAITTNTTYHGYCFRNYFPANELPAGKIGQYFVKEGTDVYLYLDYTGVITDTVAIPKTYQGKTITLVERSANVSYSDTVTGATLTVDVIAANPQTGFLILKLT